MDFDFILQLEEWYGIKLRPTGFGFMAKLKYGTLNIYLTGKENYLKWDRWLS
jgi:flavin-dependent dehydrogenase